MGNVTTITVEEANISINGINLKDLLTQVYEQGKKDGTSSSNDEKITFIQLRKDLMQAGRNLSVRTLMAKAREANVKVFRFDGKRLAIYKNQVKHFLDSPI